MNEISIKQGDTYYPLIFTVSDDNGLVDVRNCTVKFIMKGQQGIKVNRLAQVTKLEETKGDVIYQPKVEDVNTLGEYEAELHIKFPDGREVTFPHGINEPQYINITIEPRLV